MDICAAPPPKFTVKSLLMMPVYLLIQGRFEEPVRPWMETGDEKGREGRNRGTEKK